MDNKGAQRKSSKYNGCILLCHPVFFHVIFWFRRPDSGEKRVKVAAGGAGATGNCLSVAIC
jgi:hypothetical protein